MMEWDIFTARCSSWPDASMQDVVRRVSLWFKGEGKMSALKTHEDQAQLNRRTRGLERNKRLAGSEVEWSREVNKTPEKVWWHNCHTQHGKQEGTRPHIRSDNTQLTFPQGLAVKAFGRLLSMIFGADTTKPANNFQRNSHKTEPVLGLLHPEEVAICWGPYPLVLESASGQSIGSVDVCSITSSSPCDKKSAGRCLHFSTQAYSSQGQDSVTRYYYFQHEWVLIAQV